MTWKKHTINAPTDKQSQRRTVWLNDWVFACKLRGCEFGSSCSHLSLSRFFWQERSNWNKIFFVWKELYGPWVSFLKYATQLTFTCSRSTTETLEEGVKYVQNELKHQNNVIDVVLVYFIVFLLLTLIMYMLAANGTYNKPANLL